MRPTPGTTPAAPDGTLDDATAADLELGRLVAHIDHTSTTPGAVCLAELLARPLTDAGELDVRAAQLQELEDEGGRRVALRQHLEWMGRSAYPAGLVNWVREPLPLLPRWLWAHALLALALIGMLAAAIVFGGGLWLGLAMLFLTNMGVHYQTRQGIELHLDTLRELGRMVRCGKRLSRMSWPALDSLLAPLGEHAATLSRVPRSSGLLLPTRGGTADFVGGIGEYLAIAFLVETRAYGRVLKEVAAHREALAALFDGIGQLDALLSAAVFRSEMSTRCTPEFVEGPSTLDVEGLVHPMLVDPVPNSLSLSRRGCFITGSNMSGKSTFLRTVGVNAVLAQTLCVCAAGRYRASRFRIVSSLTVTDDLAHGRSFYYAEAERLLQIVRAASSPGPTLCLVDELLRGTNSVERLAAGEEILAWLAQQDALVLVATHDMEMVEGLADRYEGYHFSDADDGDALQFDHRLRPGTPVARNALRLLEHLGFPEQLVARARARVDGYAQPRLTE